jgi:hypothetical protein
MVSKKTHLVIVMILMLFLSACEKERMPIEGIRITPEVLESVSRSLTEESTLEILESQRDVTEHISETTTMPEIVYWTESGSVYHLTDQCSTLRHSNNILHGSVKEAMAAQKERLCKLCSE